MKKNSWIKLDNERIYFKKQNFLYSCFAASYQILRANLMGSDYEPKSTEYEIEEAENLYILEIQEKDLDSFSPGRQHVEGFIRYHLLVTGQSGFGIIRSDFANMIGKLERRHQRYGYILCDNRHATAFFGLWRNDIKHYFHLDPCYDYMDSDDREFHHTGVQFALPDPSFPDKPDLISPGFKKLSLAYCFQF
jgi:hypothetical protein